MIWELGRYAFFVSLVLNLALYAGGLLPDRNIGYPLTAIQLVAVTVWVIGRRRDRASR